MEMLPVKPERKAQLDDYAQRHGQDTATALDEVLENYLQWERDDYTGSLQAIHRGYQDVKNGRTRPAAEFLDEIREKHGFPR